MKREAVFSISWNIKELCSAKQANASGPLAIPHSIQLTLGSAVTNPVSTIPFTFSIHSNP